MTKDYIKELRQKVGHDPVILAFASGVLVNSNNEILLQKRSDFNCWGLLGGALEFGESAELPPIFNQQHQTIIEQFYAGTFPFYN